MMGFLDETAQVADFSGAQPLYERLAIKEQEDDYVESDATLPFHAKKAASSASVTRG